MTEAQSMLAGAGIVLAVVGLIWRMFTHYDRKNETRITEIRQENREAHEGIVKRIEGTNARIDAARDETNARINETNARINETNARIAEARDSTNARIDKVLEILAARGDDRR